MTAYEAAAVLAAPRSRVRSAAGVLALAAMTAGVLAVALHVWAGSRGYRTWPLYAADLSLGLVVPPVGALLVRRRPANAAGWVLLVSGTLIAVQALTKQWAFHSGIADPGSLPLTGLATWLASWTFAGYWPLLTLLPLLFPDGRALSPRWRRVAVVALSAQLVAALAAGFRPGDLDGIEELTNPLAVHAIPLGVFQVAQMVGSYFGFLVSAPVCLVGLTLRQRQAEGRERTQLQWLLLGFVVALGAVVASIPVQHLAGRAAGELTMAAGLLAVPASVLVAVLRAGLFDVQVVVNRAVVYAGLTAVGLALWGLVVVLAGTSVDGSTGPLLAAGIAVVATLARGRAQAAADRLLFGARRDPYRVVSSLGAVLDSALDVGVAVERLLATLRQELRLPSLRVVDASGVVVAEVGAPVAGAVPVALVDGGRSFGVLEAGRRFHGEQWREEEISLLREVARRLAGVLHAAALADDVQRSRERIVAAREEERRRLRRDLHDGLGPMLAGMALQVDGIGRALGPDDRERAGRLRTRLTEAVSEVRRIVDDLRPASLDELGLAGALQLLVPESEGVPRVRVELGELGVLPAGVEVAVYRIAAEATANALRHSGASEVVLTARREGEALTVAVTDDGCGLDGPRAGGVGLRSMEERAEELGGRCLVTPRPGGGTRVEAYLPLVEV